MTNSINLKNGLRKIAAGCLAVGMAVMQMAVLPAADTANVTAYDENYEYPFVASLQQEIDFHCFGSIGIFDEEETALIAERMYKGLQYHWHQIPLRDRSEIVAERTRAYLAENGIAEDAAEELPTAEDLLSAEELDVYGEETFPFVPSTTEATDALNKIYSCVIYKWDVGALAARRIDLNDGTDRYTECKPYYLVEDDEYEYEFEGMMEMMDQVVSEVDPFWSDVEKALYLHDWMASQFEYNGEKSDYDDEEVASEEGRLKRSPYALYSQGKAVCEGYARLYNLLLARVGIESQIVISRSLQHGWNIVKIDDLWYHVDITKDDPMNSPPGTVKHNFFLNGHYWNMGASTGDDANNSIDWLLADGRHVWELQARSMDNYAKSAAFWEKSEKRILPYGENEWLVVESGGDNGYRTTAYFNVYDFDQENAEVTCRTLHTEDIIWYAGGGFINYQYTNAVVYGENDYLIYYTPNALKVFSEDMGIRTICEMNAEETEMYGEYADMYLDGDILCLSTAYDMFSDERTQYILNMRHLERVIDNMFIANLVPQWQPWIDWMDGLMPIFVESTETTETTTAMETTTTETTAMTETTTTTTTIVTTTETTTTETTTTETTTEKATATSAETTGTMNETESTESVTVPNKGNGDLNMNGQVDVVEVINVQQILLGRATVKEEHKQAVDLDGDGMISGFDLAIMKRMVLNQNH